MLTYSYTRRDDGQESLVVINGCDASPVATSHPRFAELRDYLLHSDQPDNTTVQHMLAAPEQAVASLLALSERITYTRGQITYDGDPIDTALSRHLIRMLREGDANYRRLVRFMDNLAANPAQHSRDQLYTWLHDRDMTITEQGHFIAYKGVTNTPSNLSVNSGSATVNGHPHIGQIPNPVGATIEMPRSAVNFDPANGCSTGLHVGTWQYASTFGAKTLTVSINPRDVVSVPRDSQHQKLRTCRYAVIDATRTPQTGTAA